MGIFGEKTGNKRFALYKNGFILFIAFVLLCVGIYIISSDTLSWFSSNKKAGAGGIQGAFDSMDIRTEYGMGEKDGDGFTCGEWYDTAEEAFYYQAPGGDNSQGEARSLFSGMRPGDKVCMAARYTNNKDMSYKTAISLSPGFEIPKIHTDADDNTVYAYFGSQLKVLRAVIYAGDGGESAYPYEITVNSYLVPNPESSSYFSGQVSDIGPTHVAGDITLPGNGQLTVFIEIEFAENDQNQNLYQNFGDEGLCSRFISAKFLKEETA